MPSPGSLAILTLKDKNGISYEMKVDLKYDVITRNNNYIEDLFGFEDIHKKYPALPRNVGKSFRGATSK